LEGVLVDFFEPTKYIAIVSIPDAVKLNVKAVYLLAAQEKAKASVEEINDTISLTREKNNKILHALTAYPSGRAVISSAEAHSAHLSLLNSGASRVKVAMDELMGSLKSDSNNPVDWKIAADRFQACVNKLVSEDVKSKAGLADLAPWQRTNGEPKH
jgi:hypothetical protein